MVRRNSKDDEANNALNKIRLIINVPQTGPYNYKKIPDLNGLMATVKTSHDAMVEKKRKELLEIVRQCMEAIHTAAGNNAEAKNYSDKADTKYDQWKNEIANEKCIAILDGKVPPMWQYKDDTLDYIDKAVNPPSATSEPAKKEIIKAVPRQAMFPAKTLKSDAEIDAYLDKIRTQMKDYLKGVDGIKIN
ncbi:MAG: hypothetical protein HUJ78_06725 [Mogibacterium sp.]|nr:hypothetical protein [Mogibacterium sp.]